MPVHKWFRKVLIHSMEAHCCSNYSNTLHSVFIIFTSSLGYGCQIKIEWGSAPRTCSCMCDDNNNNNIERQETRSKPLQKQLQHFSVSKEHFYRIISYHTFLCVFSLLLLLLQYSDPHTSHTFFQLVRLLACLFARSLASLFAWQNKRRNRFFTVVE